MSYETGYAENQLHLRFMSATNEVAQHPSAGVAIVGATVTRQLLKGNLTPQQALDFGKPGSTPEPVVAVTGATHALMGAYGIPRAHLRKSIGFAYGLVGQGFITTAVEMDKHENGVALPKLEVATPEQVAHFREIAADQGRLRHIHEVLGDVAGALTDITNPEVQDPIDEYHQRILDVSVVYAQDHDHPVRNRERMEHLGEARNELASALTEPVIEALAPHMIQTDALVTAHNILRHDPGPQMLHDYLGVPLPA
jgi:hypothetical protein